jgi:hypothetical protein
MNWSPTSRVSWFGLCLFLGLCKYSTRLMLESLHLISGVDLVVHAAGPFQRDDKCTVLQAAISTKVEPWNIWCSIVYDLNSKPFKCVVCLYLLQALDLHCLIDFLWTDGIYWRLRWNGLFLDSEVFPWTSKSFWCSSSHNRRDISWSEQWSYLHSQYSISLIICILKM